MKIYYICRIAIAPLRKEPSDRSEIVSQLLFGDRVTVLEQTEKWWRVKSEHDSYEGWLDFKQLQNISAVQFDDNNNYRFVAPTQLNNTLIAADRTKYYLGAGSTLPFYNNGYCEVGDQKFELAFEPVLPDSSSFKANVGETALFFQNTPYLWGGRTLFGIDCSGFVQLVYKLNGLQLQRDASQQAEQGNLVDFLASAQVGDLAFFDNEEGKIIHVGLMLGNDQIIHSAGKVRIDRIDDQGIYNAELGRYTHKLRIIKQFV
ncbi:MAG: C40 family peptidase [Bacteroidota bacterium]